MSVQTLSDQRTWITVCRAERLQPERGAAVLLPDGSQAALFRTFDGVLYAVDNVDPFSGAAVMSRGVVGDRGGEPTVASPMHKQVFSLETGVCLDSPAYRLATLQVREHDGAVEVAVLPATRDAGS